MTYPEPPHYSNGVDLGLSPEPYGTYPRASHEYAAPMTYAGEAPFMYSSHSNSGRASPGMYPDDGEASASSSNMGSPLSTHGQMPATTISDWSSVAAPHGGLGVSPGIVDQGDYFPGEYSFAPPMDHYSPSYEFPAPGKGPGFVDPSLIHPDVRGMAIPYEPAYPAPPTATTVYPTSPALSVSQSPQLRNGSASPFMPPNSAPGTNASAYSPYSPFQAPSADPQRRPSHVSLYQNSFPADTPHSGDELREKQRCPHPECGKAFKDLKAHMLTHQTERPEKCPIATCEYHTKGFARKYDKNRHTLTHYKGTMVCGFCPGSGSSAEKSFNRADVFKRHLTAVHGVEQTPPNSRKKSGSNPSTGAKPTGYAPDATGKCSTCSQTFSNAQDFYEHLDDCVLRIVQQEDPIEAINAKNLAEVENDPKVHETLRRNGLPINRPATAVMAADADGDDENMEELDGDDFEGGNKNERSGKGSIKRASTSSVSSIGKISTENNGVQKSRGMTHSRGGVPLHGGQQKRSRKSRREYPSSWGFDKGQMNMKKRVLAVFDGPRRLVKDDMLLSVEQEVRIPLPGQEGKYITDLDIHTIHRAEAFLDATDEEKGPWISDDPTEEQAREMQRIQDEFNRQMAEASAKNMAEALGMGGARDDESAAVLAQ
ncbi:hypothetical protein VTJ83DRAFT_3384 [Remersonia thermophila]|uniref:C2H2-type domain-containing protein n=1 Tax=Remersonia thermophila TaxID=72144 RepID=A0ABR4DDU5_9PEZI